MIGDKTIADCGLVVEEQVVLLLISSIRNPQSLRSVLSPITIYLSPLLYELLRLQRPRGEACLSHCTLEPMHAVQADTDGDAATLHRCDGERAGEFQLAVNVVPHLRTVKNERDVIPLAERVPKSFSVERAIVLARLDKCIEEPLIADESGFEQDAVIGVRLLNVKPTLLLVAIGVGAKDRFHGESVRTRDRVGIDEQAVIRSVKQDCFAAGDFDYSWVAQDTRRVAADFVQSIEFPRY